MLPFLPQPLTEAAVPFDPASATIAIVTYNRSGLLSRLLDEHHRDGPQARPRRDRRQRLDRRHDRGRRVVPRTDSAPNWSTAASRPTPAAPAASARACASPTSSARPGCGSWTTTSRSSPNGLARMGAWAPRFKSIQGRRYDYDGSEFYWQYRIAEPLGIPIPFAPAGFDESGFKPMNSGCFEGMFIHRDIVEQIGLPDPRFFIYWDDQMYGWLASRKTTSVIVNEFVLRRTREIKQWDMGIRHMNASSNAYRYYIMRNRGHMKTTTVRSASTTRCCSARAPR